MDMINCEHCGKVFNSTGFYNLCPVCTERDEQDFALIKQYLCDHPFAKIFDVANDLNMSIRKIKRYLKESRLEIIEKNNKFLFCEDCGKPIRSGKYCDECYRKFHQNIRTIFVNNSSPRYSSRINLSTSKTP